MTVKTITGPSIQDALAKAREELGDDVVLMESTPAAGGAPAEIAVMIDTADTPGERMPKGRVPKPPSDDGSLPVPDTHSSGTGPSTPGSGTGGGGTQGFGYGDTEGDSSSRPNAPDPSSNNDGERNGRDFSQVLAREQGPGRGRIFPDSESPNERDESKSEGASQNSGSPFVKREEDHTHTPSEDGERWSYHPLYEMLLNKGLQPETATQLFDELADRGINLDDSPPDDLRWAFAQLLCRRIEVADADQNPNNLVVLGPGGAGKTSLILKMATHDRLLDGEPVVIHLQPSPDHDTAYQNPTSLYQKFGVAVQNVRTEEDMARALRRAESFGPVLVDTPPLSLPLTESRPALHRIESLLQPLRPLDAHFVLSATRALGNLDTAALPHLPVRPSAVSITHLDEAPTWGRVVEWLITLDLPVQFVSEGPQVPDGARAFSLEWFVKDVMNL